MTDELDAVVQLRKQGRTPEARAKALGAVSRRLADSVALLRAVGDPTAATTLQWIAAALLHSTGPIVPPRPEEKR